MRRPFPAALLAVAGAVAVFPSSAIAKKVPPPPPTPSGTFALAPDATITVSNMTLVSDDVVRPKYCIYIFEQELACNEFLAPEFSYTNTEPIAMTIRLALEDDAAAMTYYSDGTLKAYAGGSERQPGNHARLGWTADGTQILVSINDGSQNPTTDWQPTLGEGNFNATVQVTQPPPSGWAITKIEGYSDDPVLVDAATSGYACSFHAVITYTADKLKKEKRLLADLGAIVYLLRPTPFAGIGLTTGPLGASPFDTSSLGWTPMTVVTAGEWAFLVTIEDVDGVTLASQITSTFTLDDATTYADNHGCPPKGLLVSTSFGA